MSFENTAEVPSNLRLCLHGVILVTGGTLVAFCVVFLLIRCVFRTLLILQISQSTF